MQEVFGKLEKSRYVIDVFGLILGVYEVDHVVALLDLVHTLVESMKTCLEYIQM